VNTRSNSPFEQAPLSWEDDDDDAPRTPCWTIGPDGKWVWARPPAAQAAAAALEHAADYLRERITLPPGALDIALYWAALLHVLEAPAIAFAPRLVVRSPVWRCGKSTLLEALQVLGPAGRTDYVSGDRQN
jgi:hypothetical protein